MQTLIQTIEHITLKIKEGTKIRETSSREIINSLNLSQEDFEELMTHKLSSYTKKVISIAKKFYELNLTIKKELVSVSQIEKIIYAVENELISKSALKKLMELSNKDYKLSIKGLCKMVTVHIAKSKTTDEAIEEVSKLLESLSKDEIKNALALN